MKKILYLILAALFVTVGSYAQGQRALSKEKMAELVKMSGKNIGHKQSSQRQIDADRLKTARAIFASRAKENAVSASVQKRAAVRKAAIITNQPDGRQVKYVRNGSAYYSSLFGVGMTELSGALGNVVFGDNNAVYVKNLVSQGGTNVWSQGTVSGSSITFKFPQTVMEFPDYGYNVVMAKLVYDADLDWYVKAPNQTVTLRYLAETGKISSLGALASGQEIIGLIYDVDDSWSGFGDFNINMSLMSDELVEAPAGLTTAVYSLTADGYAGSLVNVGFTETEVYVQGIDKNLPETWVKGTINGNKVTFAGGQYVGADEVASSHQYLMAATYSQEYDSYFEEYYDNYELANGNIEFVYDPKTRTFSESTPFLLNAGKTNLNYAAAFNKAKMEPFTEVAATPVAPTRLFISEGGIDSYLNGEGWGCIYFMLNARDVDGNYIKTEELSYQVFVKVNGEVTPLATSAYDYQYQEAETMTEFPYDYSDGWDVYSDGTSFSFYYHVIGPEAYGVQAIYRGAGEERRSEIVWADVEGLGTEIQPEAATPAYPDVTVSADDKRIDYGFYTGQESLNTVTNSGKPETYDVAIKLSDPALAGTILESITFPIQSVSGVSDISVFVTSQLRVEGGRNVADLAVKSVSPAKGGFVTVKLDKPYLIPEGGVYVGYSLTVNNVDNPMNQTPVSITDQSHEGGFYLHTSAGYLKWLDVSEVYGGDAMITVKVTGSAVKDNAASLLLANEHYVQAGQPFTLPVALANHGANGVQSVEIRYAIAGMEDVFSREVKIDAFFGKTAQLELALPAIAQRGNYDLKLTVEKVNGVANEDANAESTQTIIVLNKVPKHRVLLEEYTGFWCGWCPRGFVALEKLAELYPDDYVLISYHNEDELEILDRYSFPSPVDDYPSAWIERVAPGDAYYGYDYETDFAIVDALQQQAKAFGYADIEVTPVLSDDLSKVEVTANVTFPNDVADANFALEYVLISDGLTDASWQQSNYYASGENGNPLYMDAFSQTSDAYVSGLTFNDVAVLTSEIGGIEGSIPTQVTGETPVTHSYSFNLADAVNTDGVSVIQNKANLKVAALLIDTTTGQVVNANKAKVALPTGISQLDGATVRTVYYDLQGRTIGQPTHGIFLKKSFLANGSSLSQKVVVK